MPRPARYSRSFSVAALKAWERYRTPVRTRRPSAVGWPPKSRKLGSPFRGNEASAQDGPGMSVLFEDLMKAAQRAVLVGVSRQIGNERGHAALLESVEDFFHFGRRSCDGVEIAQEFRQSQFRRQSRVGPAYDAVLGRIIAARQLGERRVILPGDLRQHLR